MTVATSGTAILRFPTDEQILITREFDAPRHLVYRAFTEPELVRRWWHAKRGEMKLCEIDLRVGGKWRDVAGAFGGAQGAVPSGEPHRGSGEGGRTAQGYRG